MNLIELYYLHAALIGYLLGSIPFGLILTRIAGMGDIRNIGSGNIGATNVLRSGNKVLALLTLLCDSGKGALAILIITTFFGSQAGLIGGFMAVVGHNFPFWLKFRGGKGVATTLGVLIFAAWPVGLAACATWLLIAGIFRYSSLAALIALLASPGFAYYMNFQPVIWMASGMAGLAIIRHYANILRLIKGEETKIGGSS